MTGQDERPPAAALSRLPGFGRLVVSSWAVLAGCGLVAGLASCSTASGLVNVGRDRRVVEVVAAENFWGSIARQIGGSHAQVLSIVTNPNADPHSYEPTAADARTLATAQVVIENGIGYDPWVAKLLSADQTSPVLLDVGRVLKVPDGGNPHRWYDPADVQTVIGHMAADFGRVDPADRGYFAARAAHFITVTLRPYHALIAAIRSKYAGTPVGASESIFAMLAPALGLRLITPPSFLKAISEGTDVSAADKLAIDRQFSRHLMTIYVYNSQNLTPDVQAQLAEAATMHIPTATITETLIPSTVSYQAWQVNELRKIETALAKAAGHSAGQQH